MTLDLSHLAKDVREQAFEFSVVRFGASRKPAGSPTSACNGFSMNCNGGSIIPPAVECLACCSMAIAAWEEPRRSRNLCVCIRELRSSGWDYEIPGCHRQYALLPEGATLLRAAPRIPSRALPPSEGLIALETLAIRVLRRVEPKMLIIDEAHDLLSWIVSRATLRSQSAERPGE